MRFRIFIILLFICVLPAAGWARDIGRGDEIPKGDQYPERNDTLPFALSISGGISLGSYEAGLNWALVRYLQHMRENAAEGEIYPDLAAVAGTSAGSINAFLTAATWCRDERLADSTANHVGSNVFNSTWLNVDLKELMTGHNKDDGVLSRKPFEKVLIMLKAALNAPIYRDGCTVPVGVIVTRTEPLTLQIDGITADNDRFVIPVILKAGSDRRLTFEPYMVSRDDTSLGNAIYPQGNRNSHGRMTIPVDEILQVLQASSAFPVAFGQKELKYCIRQQDVKNDELQRGYSSCPDGYVPKTGHFVDGGVFDNIPLGTTRRLAEDGRSDGDRPTTYIYMEPGNLRSPSLKKHGAGGKTSKEVTYGFLGGLRFVGGAVATGTTYELYNQLRSGYWNQQSRKMTRRAIEALEKWQVDTGNTRSTSATRTCEATYSSLADTKVSLNSIDIPRLKQCLQDDQNCLEASEFSLARQQCGPEAYNPALLQQYREKHLKSLASLSKILPDKDLRELLKRPSGVTDDRRIFLTSRFSPLTGDHLYHFGAFIDHGFRRFDYYSGVYDAVVNLARLKCSTDYEALGQLCLESESHNVYSILKIEGDKDAAGVFATLARKEYGWLWPLQTLYGQPDENLQIIAKTFTTNDLGHSMEFGDFIQALKQENYKPSGEYLKKIMAIESNEELVLLYPVIQDGLARVRHLEAEESKVHKLGPLLRAVTSSTELMATTIIGDDGSSVWFKGHAPHWYWKFLPYELGTDPINGGLYAAYEGRFALKPKVVTIDPKVIPLGWDKFGRNHIMFSQLDTYLTYHRDSLLLPSLGVGPTLNYVWETWPGYPRFNVGIAGYLSFFADKFRLTVGSRSFRETFQGDDFYINLGITDFQGIAHAIKDSIF